MFVKCDATVCCRMRSLREVVHFFYSERRVLWNHQRDVTVTNPTPDVTELWQPVSIFLHSRNTWSWYHVVSHDLSQNPKGRPPIRLGNENVCPGSWSNDCTPQAIPDRRILVVFPPQIGRMMRP